MVDHPLVKVAPKPYAVSHSEVILDKLAYHTNQNVISRVTQGHQSYMDSFPMHVKLSYSAVGKCFRSIAINILEC